mmetsp:Transcript_86089/g.150116  ORF Transcript_86089/g.150116 Transcript_86089/m.150116 type:complete len:651 (-) Transcript_86089:2100-4052(-)
MDVLAGRQHIRVPDGVTTRTRKDVLTVQGLHHSTQLVVGTDTHLLVQLNVLQVTSIVVLEDVFHSATKRFSNDGRQTLDTIILTVQTGNVDQSSNCLLSTGGLTDNVQTTGQQTGLNLHQLGVDLSNNGVTLLRFQIGRVPVRQIWHILVQIANTGLISDCINNRRTTACVLQGLVGTNQFPELVQSLVQTSVLSGWCQVGHTSGVRTTLSNGGLRGVIGSIVVQIGEGTEQTVRVASIGHTHLLTWHELQGTVGTEVKNGVSLPDVLQVGVVRRKAVVRAGRLREQKSHRITFVAESGLHTDEQITEVLPIDQHVLTIGVEITRRRSPRLVQAFRVRSELLVLVQGHAVSNVQVRAGILRLGVVDNHLEHLPGGLRNVLNGVAGLLHLLGKLENGSKNIQISSTSNVTLVRRETEHADGQLLLLLGRAAQLGPLDDTACDGLSTILDGVGLASVAVTARHDHRLDCTIQLRDGDLQSNLHGVQTQVTVPPLLSGLEHQGQGNHVRSVQLRQSLHCLRVILTSRATNQSKTSQGHNSVHTRGAPQVEVVVDRDREVKATSKDWQDLGTSALKLLNHSDVVGLVTRNQVRPLQNQTDGGSVLVQVGEVGAPGVPIQVFLQGSVILGGQRVPDTSIRVLNRLRNFHIGNRLV